MQHTVLLSITAIDRNPPNFILRGETRELFTLLICSHNHSMPDFDTQLNGVTVFGLHCLAKLKAF